MQRTIPAIPPALDLLPRLADLGIAVPDPDKVRAYLNDHSQLAHLLPDICAEVRQALGHAVELSLEVYKDPEIDDRLINLYVRQDKYDRDFLDHLESISANFNDRFEEVPGYFLLTTDFTGPRGSHAV